MEINELKVLAYDKNVEILKLQEMIKTLQIELQQINKKIYELENTKVGNK